MDEPVNMSNGGTTIGTGRPGAPPATPPGDLPVAPPGRYELRTALGIGAMGEVWLAWDTLLQREVALKLLRADLFGTPEDEARFIQEAQLQARLQHPDIVPLYDVGRLPDDPRPFFTMRVVRGRNLREACATPALGGPELRRRVEVLRRVAEAIAFAHREGLLHRDIKPSNIMLGDSGEVTVVDWGIGLSTEHASSSGPAGTPGYMAPEVLLGAMADERTDIFGLGATLLNVISSHQPDPYLDIAVQIPEGTPDDLRALVCEATQKDPESRLADPSAFAATLQSFLDGARERDRALALVAEAKATQQRSHKSQAEAQVLMEEASAIATTLYPWSTIEEKRPLWLIEARASALADEASLDDVVVLETLHAALRHAPGLQEAQGAIADVYQARHAEAEAAGDARSAAKAESLLRRADKGIGRHARWLSGEGALTLLTEPGGAEVRLCRYSEQDHRLVPGSEQIMGTTPVVEVPLDRGSWLLTLHAPGRAVVRYPVALGRCEVWDGVPPGGSEAVPIYLPREDELGPSDIYIPAGWSWLGGDPLAPRSLPRQRVWVDGFVMGRFPITNAEYLEFLNDLESQGHRVEADGLVPGRIGGEPGFTRNDDRVWVVSMDASGFVAPLDWPVVLINWLMARRFAAWTADRTGAPWRLPTEVEWERAARGVDARIFPWGNRYDATFSRISESAPKPFPVAVTDYPLDESPWGVRGLSGNVLCWTSDLWRLQGPEGLRNGVWVPPQESADSGANRAIRGAGYTGTSLLARSATRHPYSPAHRSEIVGVRLVRPVNMACNRPGLLPSTHPRVAS